MNAIKSGRYRQRVRLYGVPETSYDSVGQPSQDAALIGEYWAEVRQIKGGEADKGKQVWSTSTYEVSLRWLGAALAVRPTMKLQVVSDGSWLHVLSANNIEKRNRGWLLTCAEKVGGNS